MRAQIYDIPVSSLSTIFSLITLCDSVRTHCGLWVHTLCDCVRTHCGLWVRSLCDSVSPLCTVVPHTV